MSDSVVVRSSVSGIIVGSLVTGGTWLLDISPVVMAATGVVWTAAAGVSVYVFEKYTGAREAGPWGAVIGGSLLFNVVLSLADVPISNGLAAALTVLVIGFVTLGYAAGVATVLRQGSAKADRG